MSTEELQQYPGHVGEDVVYELPYPPKAVYAAGSPQWAHDVTDRVVRRVAELPDRTSPDDWPEAMLVTADELRAIIAEEAGRVAHVRETDDEDDIEQLVEDLNDEEDEATA